jgi:asparagine synthase (glutamine-hydrolysing)
MCGIAGLWSTQADRPPDRASLAAMVSRLGHRGPDGQGMHVQGPIGLAHTRLSIIDPAGGHQPLCNEDATVWVTFNGEIFNYRELRSDLIAQGHTLRTQSDTEVLVHLYEQLGEDFVSVLNGQFAFALWDAQRERLLLARDRVGIRPLFYTQDGPRLAFASEVKALFALPGVKRRIDPAALASIFTHWSVMPPASVFEGVQCVPPGHVLRIDAKGQTLRRYWSWPMDPEAEHNPMGEDDAAEALRALLGDAVALQLRADVPVGAYLSGGLDSSIITSIVHHHRSAPLRSFSLAFEDREFDERAHQQVLVKHLGKHVEDHHTTVHARQVDIADNFSRMVWHAESPVVRTAPVPMMLLADAVRREGYKVVLTGEGADEAFAGYDTFKEAAIRRRMQRSARAALALQRLYPYLQHSPTSLRALTTKQYALLLGESVDDPGFALNLRATTARRALTTLSPEWRARAAAWQSHAALRATLPAVVPLDKGGVHPLQRDQAAEAHTLMSGYLLSSQGDRVSMAASVEGRYPFLDHRVLEFAASLPARMKLRGLTEKRILKHAWARDLPASIVHRVKQPYRAPDSACFFKDGKPVALVQDALCDNRLRDAGIFEPGVVRNLVSKCADGRAIGFADNIAFVGVLSTMVLHAQFVAQNARGWTLDASTPLVRA